MKYAPKINKINVNDHLNKPGMLVNGAKMFSITISRKQICVSHDLKEFVLRYLFFRMIAV